ncbi:ubiquitin C-terminal hydrolase 12-like [Lycium barbarum]|uniref:ubiquitin C-terminal hydrolase 12-like n=1 Tax=Lycium barbarum TaxID=112863 RepID=UPI00293E9E74|nr:ubiquitin C-terminal hydrolase 12-like [Lycium barbarum]
MASGQVRRFHSIKAEWGCSKFISHKSLKEPCNGYLVDDNCILGAEVFVIKNQGVGECVSLLKDIECIKHEWNIFEFSKLGEQCSSKEFTVGDHKWKLLLYPAGHAREKGHSISIYLVSVDAGSFGRQKRVKAILSISVKDQISGAHHSSHWFSAAVAAWGWSAFMPLHEFKNPKKGYLVEDCCIVEADVLVVGDVNSLT